ncbi:hypothetical protein [Teredinibacter turnerae]|uniref:hypothetical protein n=1 Tax=Teredinibacter turnerae TaxID=2426 RepID=UPI0005F8419F|nr:hypothetical protein [Teredinibacter turnerae]
MKYVLGLLLAITSIQAMGATEKSGKVSNLQMWGNVAKAAICSGENSCQNFWLDITAENGQATFSMLLAAKMAGNEVYVQGYDDRNPDHPYYNASKFYGMTFK